MRLGGMASALGIFNVVLAGLLLGAALLGYIAIFDEQDGDAIFFIVAVIALVPFYLAFRVSLRLATSRTLIGHVYLFLLFVGFGYLELTVIRMMFYGGNASTWFPLIPFFGLTIISALVFLIILASTESTKTPSAWEE